MGICFAFSFNSEPLIHSPGQLEKAHKQTEKINIHRSLTYLQVSIQQIVQFYHQYVVSL